MRLIIEMETNEFLNVIKHLASKIANADMPPWAKAASDTLAKSKVASPKEIAPKKEAKVKPKQIESSLSKAGRPRGRPTTVSEQDFNKCMKLNLYSAVEVIKGYQDILKKNKGSVVLFSTVAAQRGFTNHAIIASTKAAVEGLTVSLAAEFAPNIRVNCIAPSLTNSKIAEPMLKNKALADGIAKAHPLKRLGEGKDSASLAKFLITDDSSWVTGQIIAVDGGRSKLS